MFSDDSMSVVASDTSSLRPTSPKKTFKFNFDESPNYKNIIIEEEEKGYLS